MIPKDIADYLIAQGVGTSSTIFAGQFPDDLATGIAVYQYGGAAPDRVVDLEFPSVQVSARSKTSGLTAYTLAYSAYTVLHRLTDATLSGNLYRRIDAMHSPEFVGKDDFQRFTYVVNFAVIKGQDTTTIIGGIVCGDGTVCGDGSVCGGLKI